MHSGIAPPPLVNRITDTCKNSTFPQLRLWAVKKQESSPVGCVLPAYASCTRFNRHQLLAPVQGSEVNKFEQVFCDGPPDVTSGVGPCPVRSNVWKVAIQ